MPTIQIWVNEEDYDDLKRLKQYLEFEQEQEFEGKEYKMSNSYYSRAKRRRSRIKRKKINNSYVFREAFNQYFLKKEQDIRVFEKNK